MSRRTLFDKCSLYEHTLAGEYLSWVENWNNRHPADGFRGRRIGGSENAPVTTVAGPRGAIINETLGLGVSEPITDEQLNEVESVCDEAGASDAIVEIAPPADDRAFALLAARGFRMRNFLHVYFAEMSEIHFEAEPDGIVFEAVDKSDDEAVELASRLVALGMQGLDDGEPDPHQLTVCRQVVGCPRTLTVTASISGRLAGASSAGVWFDHPLSPAHVNLVQGSTLPWARRRGVQRGLMLERLRICRDLGAVTASLDCEPKAGTQRNAPRVGFDLIYTKAVFHKPLTARG